MATRGNHDGNRTPSVKITDVARAAGVAPMTVSRVINTPERVSAETRAKVRAAIQHLGYVPNLIAGGLSSRKSRMVAAIVPTITHPGLARAIRSFSETMHDAGYQIMLLISGYQIHDDAELFRALLGRRPDALLMTGSSYHPQALQMLVEARIPVVEIWDTPVNPVDMLVGIDHAQVGAEVAALFCGKGHQRFASISATDSRSRVRARAFREAVIATGGEIVFELELPAPSTIAYGRQGMRALYPSVGKRCAVFCGSDVLAFGVVVEAGVLGVVVPEQLAVCGFGNFELSEMNEPPITTVNIESLATGKAAAELLLRRLGGQAPGDGDHVLMPFHILERATT